MKYNRSFLKWAGNKYRCLDYILQSFPSAKRLIEPFTGSASVFLNANYSEYLLAEANQDLVLLFQFIQQEGSKFIDDCAVFFCPENNVKSRYYALREQYNLSKNLRERAVLFLFLNRHGYNGLCRYNQQGIYNVPFGSYPKPYFPRKEMLNFHAKSQKAHFIHSDFRKTFEYAKPGDVIYCDPPYSPTQQATNFASYIDKCFGEEDQIQLAQLAKNSAAKGITVIISNHDTSFTRLQYRDAEITSFLVRRSINCKSDERHYVKELVAVYK